ncbi:MAG: hypothetical protein JSS68_07800 [Actinobacteria bacterium]|nr:hypothetical protein [Actinomycetota bacterium]
MIRKTFETETLRLIGGSGRQMEVLRAADAADLYSRLHRGPTLVLAVGSALVRLDPRRDPPDRRATRELADFVTYKAAFKQVRKDEDIAAAFEEFGGWGGSSVPDGFGDPRVLPFHVFDAGGMPGGLDDGAGAARFRADFGPSSRREDRSGRVWARGAFHGREALHVAGCELPPGAHWDVSSARPFHLLTASAIWEIKRGGYLNVYPDEGVRGPTSSREGQVRKVWSS